MGKKVKEYKSGDFIFAKVKGYPAWPARVQRMNGKKYFVYFYGTGETANLPPNMIFDYAENKDKFLTKTVKRRDFNDGVKQIEHDFANNVPLEEVVGINPEAAPPLDSANDTANDSAINDTMDESAMDTADDTVADTTANTTQNETAVEDSDEAGNLVIDEGKQQKGKKSKQEAKTPAKEAPKTPKTPRGKAKKDDKDEDGDEKAEEIVSRSGRKIRPKRYIDEHTEENTTLPSPAPKKRRGASPPPATEKDKEKEKTETPKEKPAEKNIKYFNNVSQAELEDLKEPFKPADAEKDNILIACLPSGQYVGIRLFQTRPSLKSEAARLQWDKRAAVNAITLKMQLEKGHITAQSVLAQLVMDLNLTDEEKATLDKEREIEEKKARVQFLKTEMKLIELDAKIKTCLCLEKADTELCLKLLDELIELDVKPLMLLKHPTCLETVKRMRAYVGNTPSWDLSESEALVFGKQAHRIRKQADTLYKSMKDLFTTPEGLSFWEFFSERVLQFKKATANLNADELLEMVHEPLEMTTPTSHTMETAIDAANEEEPPLEEEELKEDVQKKKAPAKSKKAANSTPSKPPLKRQSSRKHTQDEKEKEKEKDKEVDKEPEKEEPAKNEEEPPAENKESTEIAETENSKEPEQITENNETPKENSVETVEESKKPESETKDKEIDKKENTEEKEIEEKQNDSEKEKEKSPEVNKEEKQKEKEDEPRAKRSRGESKKTEPPPRSPARRKAKS